MAATVKITKATWTIANLPAGLSMSSTTGEITGTPTVVGKFTNPTATVATECNGVSLGTSSNTVTITINPPSNGSWGPTLNAGTITGTVDTAITKYTPTGTNIAVTA